MDVKVHDIPEKKIKFALVFFCLVLFLNCSNHSEKTEAAVTYDQKRAVNVCFQYVKDVSNLGVYRLDNLETAILGDFTTSDNTTCFKPIVSFSPGKEYAIYQEDQLISRFTINSYESESPRLLAIYPTTDNVPENLLKIYLVFSRPMEEVGNILDHITVRNVNTDKEVDVFLGLQTELWNREHTQLTLWLDPGRIKTGLIPNKEKGLPILKGNTYEITIDEKWKDANGITLDKNYKKTLVVGGRDTKKPDINSWNVVQPEISTINPLVIELNETLDAILLQESFNILDDKETLIKGHFTIDYNENKVIFTPSKNWESGNYIIEIESKLEDLAGNNLNHLFDDPISHEGGSTQLQSKFKELLFTIQ